MKCLHSQHSPGHTQIIISYFSATLWNVYASQWLLFLITALWINHSWGGLTRKHVYTGPSVNLKASLRPNQRSTTWFMKQRLNYLCASSRSCLISLLEAFALLFRFFLFCFLVAEVHTLDCPLYLLQWNMWISMKRNCKSLVSYQKCSLNALIKLFFSLLMHPYSLFLPKWTPFNSYLIAYYYYYNVFITRP